MIDLLVSLAFGAAVAARLGGLAGAAIGSTFALAAFSVSWTVVLFGGRTAWAVADAALAGCAVLLWWGRRKAVFRLSLPGWPVLAAAALALAAFVAESAWFPDGESDAWLVWNLRARWLARSWPWIDSAFSPRILTWAHPDYPLLLPSLVARLFLPFHTESPLVPMLVAAAFASTLVVLLHAGARELSGDGALPALLLLTTPAFVTWSWAQKADVPLALFVLAAVVLLLRAERTGDPACAALAGAAAALAAWTKNEGLLHLVALLGATALVQGRRRAALFALGAVPVLGLVLWFKLGYAPRTDLFSEPPAAAVARASDPIRWAGLVALIACELVFFQSWGVHLLAVGALLVARRGAHRLLVAFAFVWLGFVVAYAALAHDLVHFVRHSFDRLMIQCWPSVLLLCSPLMTEREPARAPSTGGT